MAYEDSPAFGRASNAARSISDAGDVSERPDHGGESMPASADAEARRFESIDELVDATTVESGESESALNAAIHYLIATIRQEFARERQRERDKLKHVFQDRIRQIEMEASRKVREKLARARERDREKLEERSRRLDEMLTNLNKLAREVVAQKQELRRSRDDLEQKLMESDLVQSELRHLGRRLGEQIDTFGDTLPDEQLLSDLESRRDKD